MGSPARRVVSVPVPLRPAMNGPEVVHGAEALRLMTALAGWIRSVAGEPAELRVERQAVKVTRQPHKPR